MSEGVEAQEEQQSGAPVWMVTYGDTITLLLTFFVLLLTFSSPDEENFQRFALGLLGGSRVPPHFAGASGADSIGPDQRRLESSRLDQAGAEKPPLHTESPLDALKRHYPEVDISKLEDLKGAVLIRVPTVELFGTGEELTPEGRKVLDCVVKMTRAESYSVIVRAEAGTGLPPDQRADRSLLLATRIVGYVREGAGKACEDVGLSDNVELAQPPLAPGQCDIIMLEV